MSEKIPVRNFVMPDGGAICLNVVRKHGLYGVEDGDSSVVMIKPNSIVEIIVQEIPQPKKVVKFSEFRHLAESNWPSVVPQKIKLKPTDQQPWHVWFGGECPLPEGVRVNYVLRDGTKLINSASVLVWSHDAKRCNSDEEIIAYRVAGLEDGYELEV